MPKDLYKIISLAVTGAAIVVCVSPTISLPLLLAVTGVGVGAALLRGDFNGV